MVMPHGLWQSQKRAGLGDDREKLPCSHPHSSIAFTKFHFRCYDTMLGKRKSTSRIAPVKKRRKGEPAIEEITFNFDDREEYLTGFHKRKLQRIKHAKEEALKREREEKVANRRAVGMLRSLIRCFN